VELHQKGLKSINVKTMMFVFIVELGFPMMAIIIGYEAQINPLSMEHRAKYLARTIRHILYFLKL
jgi:hypothetical protein